MAYTRVNSGYHAVSSGYVPLSPGYVPVPEADGGSALPDLNAQFGARLLSWYDAVDLNDSTLGIVSGALDTWSNRSTAAGASGTLTAATSAQRPPIFANAGPEGTSPCIRTKVSAGAVNYSMVADFTSPASDRYGIYYLGAQGYYDNASGQSVQVSDGAFVIPARILEGRSGGVTGSMVNSVSSWLGQAGGQQTPGAITSPPLTRRWRLLSMLNYIVGDGGLTSEIEGSVTTPDFTLTSAFADGPGMKIYLGAAPNSANAASKVAALVILADPTPADTAWLESNYFDVRFPTRAAARCNMILSGQSNARRAFERVWFENAWAGSGHFWWDTIGLDATSLAVDWAPASTLRTALLATIGEAPPGDPVFVIFNQGEADAANAVHAGNYETNLDGLVNAIWAVRSDAYIYTPLLPDWQTYADKATVNAAKTNIAAAYPTLVSTSNFADALPHEADNVHYTDAGYETSIEHYVSVAQTVFP